MTFTQPLERAMKYYPTTDWQNPGKGNVKYFLQKVLYAYVVSNWKIYEKRFQNVFRFRKSQTECISHDDFSVFTCESLSFFHSICSENCSNEHKMIPSEGKKIPDYLKGKICEKIECKNYWLRLDFIFFSWKIHLLEKMWIGYISFLTDDIGSWGWKSPLKKHVKRKRAFSGINLHLLPLEIEIEQTVDVTDILHFFSFLH